MVVIVLGGFGGFKGVLVTFFGVSRYRLEWRWAVLARSFRCLCCVFKGGSRRRRFCTGLFLRIVYCCYCFYFYIIILCFVKVFFNFYFGKINRDK